MYYLKHMQRALSAYKDQGGSLEFRMLIKHGLRASVLNDLKNDQSYELNSKEISQ